MIHILCVYMCSLCASWRPQYGQLWMLWSYDACVASPWDLWSDLYMSMAVIAGSIVVVIQPLNQASAAPISHILALYRWWWAIRAIPYHRWKGWSDLGHAFVAFASSSPVCHLSWQSEKTWSTEHKMLQKEMGAFVISDYTVKWLHRWSGIKDGKGHCASKGDSPLCNR